MEIPETLPAEPLSDRLRRGNLLAVDCPSRDVLRHVTSRWGVLVLIVLETGTQRFSTLRRSVGGVSERMLAQTLQWLEADGLVRAQGLRGGAAARRIQPDPARPRGRRAGGGLADWIEASMPRIAAFQDGRPG